MFKNLQQACYPTIMYQNRTPRLKKSTLINIYVYIMKILSLSKHFLYYSLFTFNKRPLKVGYTFHFTNLKNYLEFLDNISALSVLVIKIFNMFIILKICIKIGHPKVGFSFFQNKRSALINIYIMKILRHFLYYSL